MFAFSLCMFVVCLGGAVYLGFWPNWKIEREERLAEKDRQLDREIASLERQIARMDGEPQYTADSRSGFIQTVNRPALQDNCAPTWATQEVSHG